MRRFWPRCSIRQFLCRGCDTTTTRGTWSTWLAQVLRRVWTCWRRGDCGSRSRHQQPIGAAWVRLLVGDQQGYGYVDDATPELTMALLPAYRGRGIGRQLLEQLFEAGRGLYPAISLSVWPDNQPAYQLYQRLGFEIIQENEHDVVMRKTL